MVRKCFFKFRGRFVDPDPPNPVKHGDDDNGGADDRENLMVIITFR